MATFNWKVLSVDCYPQKDNLTNVIYIIYWQCVGEQDGYTAALERNTKVNCDPDNFIPFDQLTEAQVLGWVWDAEAYKVRNQPAVTVKTATELEIQNMLNVQINPPVISPILPWAN